MSRAVTADHVLFEECINAFRPDGEQNVHYDDGSSNSYLLTNFNLPSSWQLPGCMIHPSVSVRLPGAYSAFICRVDNPTWCDSHNSHLYGLALSSIVTFATGRLCKSTRDGYLCRRENLTEHDMAQLSIIYPVLSAGPGCEHTLLSASALEKYESDVDHVIKILNEVPYPIYVVLMQAIRLVYLSLLNKRDDFGLAYLLIVSAIESVAQRAIKRDKVKKNHPKEAVWAKRSQDDGEFSELLSAYKDARGQNKYLKERYIKFITKYAPVSSWRKVVNHPLQHVADYVEDISPGHNMEYVVKKSWFEKYPEDLSGDEIGKILDDSYTHRSCFIHRGQQPPHREPTSYNRFFQEYREYDDVSITERLLPNYELLFGIAQYSIRGWMDSI